jgi:hypothetical protein
VVDLLPSLAPFISNYLIQKLAASGPPAYVQRVWSSRRTGRPQEDRRAILLDPSSMPTPTCADYKAASALRGAADLGATTDSAAFIDWTYLTNSSVLPPSVFFYPPGRSVSSSTPPP